MKTIFTSAFLLLVFAFCSAQGTATLDNTQSARGTMVKYDSLKVNLGTVQLGAKEVRTIGFTNTGSRELIFGNCASSSKDVDVSCPVEAIRPGARGTIKITFTASKVGKIRQSVDMTSNTAMATSTISLKGNVIGKQDVIVNTNSVK